MIPVVYPRMRVVSSGGCRSRTIARLNTQADAAPSAWKNRSTISHSTEGDAPAAKLVTA